MTRTGVIRGTGWLLLSVLVGVAMLAPGSALATKPDPAHKVVICHGTNSDTNPYRVIEVDIASSGYLKAGHVHHTGPIWNDTLKDQKIAWGDIIPPYAYGDVSYPGLNWTPEGQAIWANGCAIPEGSVAPSESASESPTTTPFGSVLPEEGTNPATLPPTDALAGGPLTGGWRVLLLSLAGLLGSLLLLTPGPLVRRR